MDGRKEIELVEAIQKIATNTEVLSDTMQSIDAKLGAISKVLGDPKTADDRDWYMRDPSILAALWNNMD